MGACATGHQALTVNALAVRLKGFTLGPLSFALHPGKITVLLGHNGAGKTTTMRLLMGLVRRDQGTVTVGRLTLDDEIPYRNRIGFVPEEAFYYRHMTVEQVVCFTAGFYPNWSEERCRLLQSELALDMTKRIRHLSKGTRMKLSLLLALACNPDVLLLDEPTSGLDPRSRVIVLNAIKAAAVSEGQSVLLSTHNLSEAAQIADQVLIVDRGKIVADRPTHEVNGSLESFYLGLVQ